LGFRTWGFEFRD